MPTPRSWLPWRAVLPALLLCTGAAAHARALPPCAGSQQERWHECVGSFEDRRSGVQYNGEFRNGTMHGVGVLRTPVTIYAGDFAEGRMHGQGVLTMLEDRRQYSGGFRNGLMHGSGTIIAADGRVLANGRFQDGALAAPATPPAAASPAVAAPRAGLGATLGESGPGRPAGAVVVDVGAGSAARRGGLAPGDVVVGLGGWRIARPSDLEAAVNAIEQDGVVMLRLLRNGIEMELAVPLAAVNAPAPVGTGTMPTPTTRAQGSGGAALAVSTADPPRAGANTTSTSAPAAASGTTTTATMAGAPGQKGVASTSSAGGATGTASASVSTGTPGRTASMAAAVPAAPAPPTPARPQPAAGASPPATPPVPSAPPALAVPQGLYLVRQGQASLAQLDVWYFGDGRFAQSPRAATAGAATAFDFVRAETQRPGSTGAFVLDGARLMVSGPALPLTAARVEPAASNCFRWNDGLYCPAPRFARGARLDGVFASASTEGVTAVRAAFKADGSYEITRAASNRGAPPARERGRYEIDGNVLRLRPAGGGAPTALTVVPYDDGTPGPPPRRLFLGGTGLGRQ